VPANADIAVGFDALAAVLRSNGWRYLAAANTGAAAFPAHVTSSVRAFSSSFDQLSNTDETCWFLSHLDYASQSDSAFAWNEFELNETTWAITPEQRQAVHAFWQRFLPLAISVKDDHQFIAMGIAADNAGQFFLGETAEPDELVQLADNLDEFVACVTQALRDQHPRALARFLSGT